MRCDHDLPSAEEVDRVGDRLHWIGIADHAFCLDPGSVETLEGGGEAEAGAAPGLIEVGQPVAEARVESRRDYQHLCGRVALGPERDQLAKRRSLDGLIRHYQDPSLPASRRGSDIGFLILHRFLSSWLTFVR
jgi:hypothetical protein